MASDLKAFGAGMTGADFDHKDFLKKPGVLCKIGAGICSAVVWYCVYKGGWVPAFEGANSQICVFNASSSTCSFVSAFGFFSFAAAISLMVADAKFGQISAVQTRSRVVRADFGASAVFAVGFLLSFFSAFTKLNKFEYDGTWQPKYAKMAVFLQVLAAAAWGGAAFLGWRRYQAAAAESYEPENFDNHFQTIPGDAAEGYGYGGNEQGIGAVDGNSYQQGGPVPPMQQHQQQYGVPHQQQQRVHHQLPQEPSTNPFVGQPGYQY